MAIEKRISIDGYLIHVSVVEDGIVKYGKSATKDIPPNLIGGKYYFDGYGLSQIFEVEKDSVMTIELIEL